MALSEAGARGWHRYVLGNSGNLLPGFIIALAVLLVLVPLAVLLIFSFRSGTPWNPGPFTLGNYTGAYGDGQTYTMLGNTLVLALCGTAISVSLAVFFAFLTERTDMPFRNVAWMLLLVPIAIPGILFAISWTFLLSPRIGLFNVWMRDVLGLFGWEMREGPLNIYSMGGLIFLDGLRGVTTVFMIIVGAFRTMDPNLEEAARISGASNRRTFFRILLPLLTPAIMAGGIYSFMTSLESLEVPLVVGLPGEVYVFSSYIYFSTQRFSPPQYGISAALGATFLILSILLVWWYRRQAGRLGRYVTITGKGYRPRIVKLGKWRYPCFAMVVLYTLLTIVAPCLILLWSSLQPLYRPPTWELLQTANLRNYAEIFADPKIWDATLNTILVAVVAGTLTMAIALIVAWGVQRMRFRGRGVVDGIMFLPNAIPGVIVGVAIIIVFTQPPMADLSLYGSIWIIVLGLVVHYLAFGTRTMNGAVAQLHVEMEEAGKVSGAKWRTVMRRIVLPLLLPSFISGWIWVAAHALRNFSIPVLLSSRDSRMLSVELWHAWDDGDPGRATALGVLLIVALVVFTVIGRMLVVKFSRQQG
ncbi:MAG: iron ABC transporter permease [Alphaproteobacteria bacterium]